MRRLPGPADSRLSEGDHPPEVLYELFSGLAENTNSIFCDGPSEPETANGCLVLPSAGTDAERHTVRIEHPGTVDRARSRERARDTRASA